MLSVLQEAYEIHCKKGGRPLRALSIWDKLVIMLQYYREYRTMQHIAFDYGVSKTAIWKSIRQAEDILIKSMAFSLPSKRRLLDENSVKAVLIDATECEIERPKKKNRKFITRARKRNIR